MAKQIGEDTKVTLDLKTIGMIVTFVVMLAGTWFALQADIEEAKELSTSLNGYLNIYKGFMISSLKSLDFYNNIKSGKSCNLEGCKN